MSKEFSFIVQGEPASKANSRQIVTIRGRPAVIKSAKARRYVTDFQIQCPRLDPLLEGDLAVSIKVFYASRRPDLDVSLLLDAMENFIYSNDRQVREQHLYWALDKKAPRAEIKVKKIKKSPPEDGRGSSASEDWQTGKLTKAACKEPSIDIIFSEEKTNGPKSC